MDWRLGFGVAVVATLALSVPPTAQAAPVERGKPAPGAGARAGKSSDPAGGAARRSPIRGSFSVTLITGDTVTVTTFRGDRRAVTVKPAKGRERIPYTTHRTKNGLAVVPADAIPLLAANRLDQRLFDVELLERLGYNNRHRTDLPLMVSGPKGRAAAPAAPAGSRQVRALPRLGITVLRTEKRDTPRLWASLTAKGKAATKGKAAAGGKIWLVGKLKPTLDVSVPQVGAPVAWQAGHTGQGVKVAVLDTGYDQRHPDLQGVVTASRDFTGSESGVQDTDGHGTHVASTIAGRGTASNGRYTGVAKGAELQIGKVCYWGYCPEDAILAGIEWAATSGAKVVNMSLGGPASENGDPIEDAVNDLSRANDVLFVIAAGNDGPTAETVSSPGTADAALTVGSVNKSDQLSKFSSRGPRVPPSRQFDYGVKPDITAPGEDIVAARAEGTLDPVAVDEHYARLSGTSMATPHVAGAAAILAGEHPDWTSAQLKAALTSTAKPRDGLSVYQQGAGRLDVGRAATQTVHASAGVLSLGYFPWPNANAPTVHKTVTYTNSGSAPVTLRLAISAQDERRNPAPAGMFTASAPQVTVPAGGTSTVTVAVSPAAGPVGLYSGALTATSTDSRTVIRTVFGAYKEPESYNLSVSALDRSGGRGMFDLVVTNRRTGDEFYLFEAGTISRRLPAGDYTIAGYTHDFPADGHGGVQTTAEVRGIRLGQVNEVILDARRGQPLRLAVDRPDATPLLGLTASTVQVVGDRMGSFGLGSTYGNLHIVPGTERIPGMEFSVSAVMVKAGTGGEGQPPSPYTYNLTFPVNEQLPADPRFRFVTSQLAAVKQTVNRQGPDEVRDLSNYGFTATSLSAGGEPVPLGELRERTDYVTTHRGVEFATGLGSGRLLTNGVSSRESLIASTLRSYAAGRTYTETWNTAVFGPSFNGRQNRAPHRQGDQLFGEIPLFGDSQPGHYAFPNDEPWSPPDQMDTGTSTLRRNGAVIGTWDRAGFVEAAVPADAATYRLETTVRRAATWSPFAKRIDVAWTFRSAHVAGDKPAALSLQVVRYRPALNEENQAPASGSFSFPVSVERAPGAPAAAVTALTVEVSYDGGQTWTAAQLTGAGAQRTAKVQHPGRAGFASLRATAVDAAGNQVEQTILNAYALK